MFTESGAFRPGGIDLASRLIDCDFVI